MEKQTQTKPSIHMYLVFHSLVFENLLSELSEEDKQKITLYGVRARHQTKLNVVYEYELPIYNPCLQENVYNEGSAFYHIFKNKYLYNQHDYIGFGQYDMKLFKNTFTNINQIICDNPTDNCIFVNMFFPDIKESGFRGGHTLIVSNMNTLEAGLSSYNRFFNKQYTPYDVMQNKLIACNIFVIKTSLFEKLMSWLIAYFIDDIKKTIHPIIDNAGVIPEALIGMFLSLEVLEGSKYHNFEIEHVWPHYKLIANNH
jgi:hypothetical protein